MITTVELAQSEEKELRDIGIKRIIENAVKLAKDPEWGPWKAYEIAKDLIRGFIKTEEEYESAIRRLTEALNI